MEITVKEPFLGERGPRQPPGVAPQDVLFWTRWEGESIEPSDFLPITDTLRPSASRGSKRVLDSVLRPEAHIYGKPESQHSFHVNPDCLLHRYDVGDLALLIYEQQLYITVRVAATALAGEPQDAFVRRVTGRLLNFTPTWYFFPASAPGESVRFSTEPDYTIGSARMSLGISGAIVHGGLYFTRFRWRSDDYSGRATWEHPLVSERLREHWAKVRGTATP